MSMSEWLRDTPYVDINARTAFGFTALHLAVLQDKVAIVETLLRNGVDVSIQDTYGWTALHFAVLHNPPEIELNLDNDPLWTWIGHKELHIHDDAHEGQKYQKYLKQQPITFRKKTQRTAKAIV
jgi:ankyrin repeat protein